MDQLHAQSIAATAGGLVAHDCDIESSIWSSDSSDSVTCDIKSSDSAVSSSKISSEEAARGLEQDQVLLLSASN